MLKTQPRASAAIANQAGFWKHITRGRPWKRGYAGTNQTPLPAKAFSGSYGLPQVLHPGLCLLGGMPLRVRLSRWSARHTSVSENMEDWQLPSYIFSRQIPSCPGIVFFMGTSLLQRISRYPCMGQHYIPHPRFEWTSGSTWPT